MRFKQPEIEFIKTIVKFEGEEKSIADVLNRSGLLQDRGIGIVPNGNEVFVFLSKDLYDWEDKQPFDYITELIELVDRLVKDRYISLMPYQKSYTLAIGGKNFKPYRPEWISVNNNEFICLEYRRVNWLNMESEQIYWPNKYTLDEIPITSFFYWYTTSQELKDLVKNKFKTEEEIRFIKQQHATWFSIGVAIILGILILFQVYLKLFGVAIILGILGIIF